MRTFFFFGLILGAFFSQNATLNAQNNGNPNQPAGISPMEVEFIEKDSTNFIKNLVNDAAQMLRNQGEAAFEEFRKPESRWRKGETYIFVLDKEGNMLVHADPEMENKNQLDLLDVNGKPIIRGLLAAATALP